MPESTADAQARRDCVFTNEKVEGVWKGVNEIAEFRIARGTWLPYSLKKFFMPTVEFLIEKKKIKIGKFANLKKAARKHGIHLSGPIEVVEGLEHLSPRSMMENVLLKDKPAQFRLPGETEVLGDVCVISNFSPKPSRQ